MIELNNYEIKRILLDILKEIDEFCSKNNITYFLAYGTLLGAVRHNGFIPWDDDIDICMPRPDYEIFIDTFISKDSRYEVVAHTKDNKYPYFFAKVHDSNTYLETKSTFKDKMGLFVDVFPIDALPEDIGLQKKNIKRFIFYRNIFNIKALKYDKDRSIIKNLTLFASRFITTFIPISFLVEKIDKISMSFNYSDHKLVSISATTDQRLILSKELFSEVIRIKFEDMEAPVPKKYKEILRLNYGDYLKLPPKEKQVSHHKFRAFKTT